LACRDGDPETCGCEEVKQSDYRGTVSKTAAGVECQRWDSQEPHKHSRTRKNYPEMGLSENYCRNPDGEAKGTWCYTTDPEIRWQYCDVPICGHVDEAECEDSSPETCGCGEVKQSDYRGTINTTISGYECQMWNSISPNTKARKYINAYPRAGLNENYCRNPSGKSKMPWCYTTDPSKRWEYCDIPTCGQTLSLKSLRVTDRQPVSTLSVDERDEEVEAECSKDSTDGWHSGSYVQTLLPKDSPNGIEWQWQECAKACAEYDGCEFWTLKSSGKKTCALKANKGTYYDEGDHIEGSKDSSCLEWK